MQGRPLNVNHEAACIIGKTGGEVETDTLHPKQGGKWKSISVGKNRGEVDIIILLLWNFVDSHWMGQIPCVKSGIYNNHYDIMMQ